MEGRIMEFDEKPMVADSDIVSTGVYVIRRRTLIELLEQSNEEGRYNFVTDVLIRQKGLKKIMDTCWTVIGAISHLWRVTIAPIWTFEKGYPRLLLPSGTADPLQGI